MVNDLRRIVDALPELVWSAHFDGRVELLSQRWREHIDGSKLERRPCAMITGRSPSGTSC
jgi:hypothetical protein